MVSGNMRFGPSRAPIPWIRHSTGSIPVPGDTCQNLQLNDSIVKRRAHPRSHWVKCEALDSGRFTLKLGQHRQVVMRAAARQCTTRLCRYSAALWAVGLGLRSFHGRFNGLKINLKQRTKGRRTSIAMGVLATPK
jgi:hypothetical protein